MIKMVNLTSRKEIMTYDFSCPKQVFFATEDLDRCAGIAWGEMVICGCCGGTIPFDEILSMNVIEDYWIDLDVYLETKYNTEIEGG